MKHLEVRQKNSAGRRVFNSLLSVSSGDACSVHYIIYDWITMIMGRSPTVKIAETDY